MHSFVRSSIALIVAFSASSVYCSSHEDYTDLRRLTDEKICDALNRLHEILPDSASLDEKCRRYAILLFKITSDNTIYKSTVSDILAMDKDCLDNCYEKVGNKGVSSLLMNAIDKYRLIGLAPVFIDLLDCLRLIDTPYTQAYLFNRELKMIEELYKQVLSAPDQMVDIEDLKVTRFQPSERKQSRFKSILPNLFRDYIRNYDIDTDEPAKARTFRSELQVQRRQAEERFRHRSYRVRERARLNSQRRRVMSPESWKKQLETQRELRSILESLDKKVQSDDGPVEIERMRQRRRRELYERQERRSRRREKVREERQKERQMKRRQQEIHHVQPYELRQESPGHHRESVTISVGRSPPLDASTNQTDDLLTLIDFDHIMDNQSAPSLHSPAGPKWGDNLQPESATSLNLGSPNYCQTYGDAARRDSNNTMQCYDYDAQNYDERADESGDVELVRQYLLDEPQTSDLSVDPNAAWIDTTHAPDDKHDAKSKID